MTSAFNFSKVDTSVPSLPSLSTISANVLTECTNNLAGFSPTQEPGTPLRPSGSC